MKCVEDLYIECNNVFKRNVKTQINGGIHYVHGLEEYCQYALSPHIHLKIQCTLSQNRNR